MNFVIWELGIAVALGVLLLSIIIGAFFVWLGAKMAKVEKGTFGRAIMAAVTASLASSLVAWLCSFISGPFWSIVGSIVGLVVVIGVFKMIFGTTWGKAFLIWFMQLIAIFIVILIAGFTFAAALLI